MDVRKSFCVLTALVLTSALPSLAGGISATAETDSPAETAGEFLGGVTLIEGASDAWDHSYGENVRIALPAIVCVNTFEMAAARPSSEDSKYWRKKRSQRKEIAWEEIGPAMAREVVAQLTIHRGDHRGLSVVANPLPDQPCDYRIAGRVTSLDRASSYWTQGWFLAQMGYEIKITNREGAVVFALSHEEGTTGGDTERIGFNNIIGDFGERFHEQFLDKNVS